MHSNSLDLSLHFERGGSCKYWRLALVIASSNTPQVAPCWSSFNQSFKDLSKRSLCLETSSSMLSSTLAFKPSSRPICLQYCEYGVRISVKLFASTTWSAKSKEIIIVMWYYIHSTTANSENSQTLIITGNHEA